MTQQIHGHEVMHMMLESGQAYTRDSLRKAITERYGEAARFYTCSAEGMTPDQLIDFLDARGKFQHDEQGLRTDPSQICDD